MERKITFRFGHSRTLKNHISFLIWRHLVFAIILGERITPLALAGTALIIFGVSVAQRHAATNTTKGPADKK